MQEQAGVPRKLPRSGLVQLPLIDMLTQLLARFVRVGVTR
jgi:hypothetical protein